MEPIITTIVATLAAKFTTAFLTETAFAGLVGNRVDGLITSIPKLPGLTKRLLAQFKDTEKPVNHDLQKAIASSHWLATKVFCEKFKRTHPHDILDSVLRVTKKRLDQINHKDYVLPDNNTPDSYEADLLILKDREEEALEILKTQVIEYHLQELKSLLKEREVETVSYETLENALRNGLAEEKLNWFDLVCAFLNELLKGDNNKARDAFQNQQLATIGREIGKLKELIEVSEKINNGFVTKIGIEQFEELKNLVRDELLEINSQLNEIKKGINEIINHQKNANNKLTKIEEDLSKINPTLKFAQKLTPIPELGTFIGRDEDLAELSQTLATANQVVLMNGMGGIGKTTLARAYVNRNLSAFNHIAWISVIGDNIKEAFTNAIYFDEALKKAQSVDGDRDTRFAAIVQTINNLAGKGLLIIDNAEEDIEDIRQFLPPPPQWQILLTSRLELKTFKEIRLEKLSPEYAEEVFKEYYGKPIKEEDYNIFQNLLKEIDYHTLTIELVAKTMRESDNNLKFDEVLEKLQQRQLNHQRMHEVINVSHLDDKQAILYEHLMTSFNLAQLSREEIWVLKQFTALPPEPILKDTLTKWLQLDENKTLEFEQALKTLRNKGWLKRAEDVGGNVQYTIHRLIQDMVHYQYRISFEDIEELIDSFKELLNYDINTNFSMIFPYLPIAEYILNALPEATENISIALLYNRVGFSFKQFADFKKAELNILKALEIYKNQNNEESLVICQESLALLNLDLGNYKEAKRLLELVLAFNIKNFGLNHPKVANSHSNLAIANKDLGNSQTAKELLELALTSDIKNFGLNHPIIAIMQSNLAMVNRDLGNYPKAKELLELALESDIKKFGLNHPNVSIRQSNLALVNGDLGDYPKAKELLELALKSDTKNFGLNHPTVATRQWYLAATLVSLEDLEEAKQLLDSAYETFRTRLGEGHRDTKSCLSWLNDVNEQLG